MGLTERVLELISDQDESEKKNVKPIEKPELNLPRCLELPLGKPFYSTYHFQGITGAISLSNPSLRNWYLNESVSLCCERVFLYGFSSPHLNIVNSSWLDTPHIDKIIYPTRFLNELLNEDNCSPIQPSQDTRDAASLETPYQCSELFPVGDV